MVNYNTFLTQFICFLIISLACLSIGFGSWLETNDLLYSSSPSVSRHLSVFEVALVSTHDTYYLTFGLWRYCVHNVSNNISKCSPIKMNFNIDAFTVMNNSLTLSNNSDQLPPLLSVSYVRLIPLLIATFIGVVSLGISLFLLPGNHKKSVQRRALLWLTSILCFVCAALTSITFGVTFSQYSTNIKEACSLLLSKHDDNNNNYTICQSYTPSVEIILLGLAVGLFIISTVYCTITVTFSNQLSGSCKTQYTNNSNFSFFVPQDNDQQTREIVDINEKQTTMSQDETMVWNKERLSLRPPPPFINNQLPRCRSTTATTDDKNISPLKHHKIKVTNKGNSNADNIKSVEPNSSSSLATTDIKYTSSSASLEDVLRPPTLPFANNGTRHSYNHNNSRPLSHGSDNTFGAFSNNDPNSPSADDASMSSSSYMDNHPRSDSVTSHNNSHLMYATSAMGGAQSNHTLGTFPLYNSNTKPSSQHYMYYNSSYEGDEEDRYPSSSSSNNNNSTENTATTAGSTHSIPLPEQGSNITTESSASNNNLYKRINEYLHQQT